MKNKTLTYNLCLSIELTRLCSAGCDFCPYPFTAHEPLLPLSRIRKAIGGAHRLGATLLDFTSGENPEAYPEILHSLQHYRQKDYLDYLVRAALLARAPQWPHTLPVRLDAGPVSRAQWRVLRRSFSGVRLHLTTGDAELAGGVLQNAPSHHPAARLAAIEEACVAGIPLNTGTMVGLGESAASRELAIRSLAHLARKYGNIETFALQAFRPHPATPMAGHPPTSLSDLLETLAVARHYLPPTVRVQINALDWRAHLLELVQHGASDVGDLNLNVLLRGHTDPGAALAALLEPLRLAGYDWKPRTGFRPALPRRPPLRPKGAPAVPAAAPSAAPGAEEKPVPAPPGGEKRETAS